MLKKSAAAAGLFKWATSTDQCYDIFKNVEPKRKMLEDLQKKSAQAQADLEATEKALNQLTESLGILNGKMKEKKDELDELERLSLEMTRKLNAASKLITGLGSE